MRVSGRMTLCRHSSSMGRPMMFTARSDCPCQHKCSWLRQRWHTQEGCRAGQGARRVHQCHSAQRRREAGVFRVTSITMVWMVLDGS